MPAPPPPRDFDTSGWAEEDAFRLVPRWLFGARLEQLFVHQDGRRKWRRCDRAVTLPIGRILVHDINTQLARGERINL